MTGPQHYKEAERIVERVATWTHGDPSALIAEAQVHATLALAAATAVVDPDWTLAVSS